MFLFLFAGSAAALFLLYAPGFHEHFFLIDDLELIATPQLALPFSWKLVKALFTPATHIDFYPVRDFSYWLDLHVFHANSSGDDGFVFRLHNFGLLLVASVLIYRLLLVAGVTRRLASWSALLWLWNPFHAEILVWLSSRKDLLALVFALAAALLYLWGLKSERKCWFGVSFIFFMVGILSKASFTLLPLVALVGLAFEKSFSRRRTAAVVAMVALVVGVAWSGVQSWHYTQVNDMRFLYPYGYRLLAASAAMGRAFGGWFYAPWNAIDPLNVGDWAQRNAAFAPLALLPIAGTIVLLRSAFKTNRPALMTAIVGAVLSYVPVSGLLFPHRHFYACHYFEAFFLFLWIAVTLWLSRFKGMLPACALACLVFATFKEAKHWESGLAILDKSLSLDPQNPVLLTLKLQELTNLQRRGRTGLAERLASEDIEAQLRAQCLPKLDLSVGATGDLCAMYFWHLRRLSQNNWQLLDISPKLDSWLDGYFTERSGAKAAQKVRERFKVESFLAGAPLDLMALKAVASRDFVVPALEDNRIELWAALCAAGQVSDARSQYEIWQSRGLIRIENLRVRIGEFKVLKEIDWHSCLP